ncbi:hypothetical protein A4308_12225 [Enterobacter sp. ODB01]|nr:hypothetical protein A4308_12225 [Enterobacter sp. ODB01]
MLIGFQLIHLHNIFQAVSLTGIRTILIKTEQCQKFDGDLTGNIITSLHIGPATLIMSNIATFTICS